MVGVASIKFKSLSSVVKLVVDFGEFGYLILRIACVHTFLILSWNTYLLRIVISILRLNFSFISIYKPYLVKDTNADMDGF